MTSYAFFAILNQRERMLPLFLSISIVGYTETKLKK